MFNLLKKEKISPNDKPLITIVVATFNRADALALTLRSAIAQTYKNWHMLVIGDACTDDTERMIETLHESRIQFINLPERFGEQAGPNSVGIALAKGDYVAFLNHDDLWLPTHLELAVDTFRSQGGDLYWSRAAFYTNRGPRLDLPMFVEASPIARSIEDAYDAPFYYSEPISSWVITKQALELLGFMRLSSEISVVPIYDYVVRAHEIGLTLCASEQITVLKDNMNQVRLPREETLPHYSITCQYNHCLIDTIESQDVALLKAKIDNDLWLSQQLNMNRSFAPQLKTNQTNASRIRRNSGIDIIKLKAQSSRTHFMGRLGIALKGRTGESLSFQPKLEEMIQFAKRQLD